MASSRLEMSARSEANSLQRGLAVLELLSARPDGTTLREITDHLELPGASVLRITRTLVELGYPSRGEGTKRYFLTNRFLLLGQPSMPSRGLPKCAIVAMRQIRQATADRRPASSRSQPLRLQCVARRRRRERGHD